MSAAFSPRNVAFHARITYKACSGTTFVTPSVVSNTFEQNRPISSLENGLVSLWRTPALNRVLNAAVPFAPAPVRGWVERQRARVRQAELRAQIHARGRLVPEGQLRALLSRALRELADRNGPDALGSYLEFGVYNGTSLLCMYRELDALGLRGVRLFGFDSFQGLPPEAAQEDEGRWEPGRCHSPLEFTTAVLASEGVDWRRVSLIPGWYSDTLKPETRDTLGIGKASVIMIDCDLYSSSKQALEFCAPLIEDEALILFDEFHPRGLTGKYAGERRAFDEFLKEQGCFTAKPFGQYAPRTETFLVSRIRSAVEAATSCATFEKLCVLTALASGV
jgi:O-methyltransferase